MIKNSIVGFLLLSLAFVSCKENASSKIDSTNLETAKERDAKMSLGSAIIEFDKNEFDFGTINEGDVVEGAFKVANKGKTDLIITDASASCGCTVPEWPKDAIKPGDSAIIKFSFNSRGKRGKQSKTITLKTNTANVTETLRIAGTVTPKS
ncbi:MAG: DUF1573 domain-containing protein [Flavobacteriaceae bacterium]|nr:DUF1573 domain-containing protein [Flavobacteriaceae bacterium]